MKRKTAAWMAAGMIIMMGLAGCSQAADKAGVQQTETAVVQAAEAGQGAEADTKESPDTEETQSQPEEMSGTIVLYTSQPEEDAQKLIDGFNEIYPNITVDVFRSGTEEVVSKVLAEQQAGVVLADVLLVADSVTFETLKEEGMLEAYESPELAGIPAEYVDKDNMYTGTKVITTGIIYNTEIAGQVISGFGDLAKEEFKDNLIMPSPLYSGAAAYNVGVMSRTEGLGWDYFKAVKDNGVTVDKGNGAVQKAVVAGEKACGIIVDYMANRSKKDGAPVEFVYPLEGSPAITEPIGLMAASDNKEQAKALIDFVLSEEGQALAAEIGYTPVKEGLSAPEGLKTISEIKTMSQDVKELYQNREADKTKFSEIFQ